MLPGEYVQLNFSYGTQTVFQVNSLGNGTFGSDLYVFNLYNIGYTGNTFTNNKVGTFKKIIDVTNSAETMSSYYVKTHKVLTNVNDLVVTKDGFEEVPFSNNKKFEFSSLTPNNICLLTFIYYWFNYYCTCVYIESTQRTKFRTLHSSFNVTIRNKSKEPVNIRIM